MSWKKYYTIEQISYFKPFTLTLPQEAFVIVFNDDYQEPGIMAHIVYYRTERLAVRGAERLYKRTHGAFEEAFLGIEK